MKLSLVEAARVLDDLSPWLKKNGYLSASAPLIPAEPGPCPAVVDHRIYFSPMPNRNGIAGPLFRYLIQSSVERRIEQTHPDQRVVESFTERLINWTSDDGSRILWDPGVRMLHPGALLQTVVTRLQQHRQ